jgi:hypothetical protein
MKSKRIIFYSIIAITVLIILALWHGRKQLVEVPPIAAIKTNASVTNVPVITRVYSNAPSAQVVPITPAPTPPLKSDEQQKREGLSELNNVDVNFYGRLEDQYGNAVGNAQIKFEIPFNDGHSVGVHRGTTMAGGNGFFTISGYKGKSLDVIPVKSGYALASLNGGGIYSYLWPESQRAHPDPNNPVVIQMWKLQGAEPLVSIGKEYKIPYSDKPICFDLITGQIVPSGGDIRIAVNRPEGIISQQHPQNWSIQLEVIDGGLIETDSRQFEIAYAAPEEGYQPSDIISSDNGSDTARRAFFIQSRNGQVYSKLGLSFHINDMPDGLMYIRFGGVANTNSSRNWEATAPQN